MSLLRRFSDWVCGPSLRAGCDSGEPLESCEPLGLGPVLVQFPPEVRLHLLVELADQAGCDLKPGPQSRTLVLVPRAADARRFSTAPDLAPEGI